MKFTALLSHRRVLAACLLAVALCLPGLAASTGGPKPGVMKVVQTKYYTINSDMDDDFLAETWVRLDRMFEDYSLRTAALGRDYKDRLPVYIYSQHEDYLAAGGLPKSSGVFRHGGGGARLMADVQDDPAGAMQTLQHEEFHQFVWARLGTNIPVWANEGLACYFEEALFTGDSFVPGIIGDRFPRLKRMIAQHDYKPFAEFVEISSLQWRGEMSLRNYAQAWSMIHFLYHGKPEYRVLFDRYLKLLGSGVDPSQAWKQVFGTNVAAFEKAWLEYWSTMTPPNPDPLRIQARALTLVSFGARAHAAGVEEFKDADAFFAAAAKGFKLKHDPLHWLPPKLLEDALKDRTEGVTSWSIKWTKGLPEFTASLAQTGGGGTIRAGFQNVNGFWRTIALPMPAATMKPAAKTTQP